MNVGGRRRFSGGNNFCHAVRASAAIVSGNYMHTLSREFGSYLLNYSLLCLLRYVEQNILIPSN